MLDCLSEIKSFLSKTCKRKMKTLLCLLLLSAAIFTSAESVHDNALQDPLEDQQADVAFKNAPNNEVDDLNSENMDYENFLQNLLKEQQEDNVNQDDDEHDYTEDIELSPEDEFDSEEMDKEYIQELLKKDPMWFRLPRIRFPRIRFPRIRLPRIRFPRIRIPRIRLPPWIRRINLGCTLRCGQYHKCRIQSLTFGRCSYPSGCRCNRFVWEKSG